MEFIKINENINKNFSKDLKIGNLIEIDKDFVLENIKSKQTYTAKDYNLQDKKAMICKNGILDIPGFITANIKIPNFKFSGYNFNDISKHIGKHLDNCYSLYDMILDYNGEDYLSNVTNIEKIILKVLNQVIVSEKEVLSLTELDVKNLSNCICNELDKTFEINYLFEHELYWNNQDAKYEDVINSVSILLTKFFN